MNESTIDQTHRNSPPPPELMGETPSLANGSTPTGPDLPPDCRYERRAFIAAGGLGQVFSGWDRELGRAVALKFVKASVATPEAIQRFVREAEITGRLEHPGIPPVYGLFPLADGAYCYAMRLFQGQTLRLALLDYHELPAEQKPACLRGLLRHFVDICNTIAFAHDRGILHRDIKPANIMLGAFGETWVLDWGLAKDVSIARMETDPADASPAEISPDTLLTRAGTIVGTPGYMSPEQATGSTDSIGPRSDVFSLGAILGAFLTDEAPRSSDWLSTRPADCPAPLFAIVRKALHVNPAERYTSV
ncbi:MAG: serine/threonine-protein kinase, partial [Gemmataceae bacterium]